MEGPPSDETLLVGVAERDIGAFRALYERHTAGAPVHAGATTVTAPCQSPTHDLTRPAPTRSQADPQRLRRGGNRPHHQAGHQRRTGTPHPLFILAPLLTGIIPDLAAGPDSGPIGLALLALADGYAVSSRGPLWTRIVAGIVNLAGIAVTFLAPKPYPDLSYTAPHEPAVDDPSTVKDMRAVIQAVVLDGLSAREAAQLLDVPVSSVKTRLYRAKAHLRAALAEGSS